MSNNNDNLIQGISAISNIALIKLQGENVDKIESNILEKLIQDGIDSRLVAKAAQEDSICIAIKSDKIERTKKLFNGILKDNNVDISYQENLSIITIAGENMKGVPGTSGRLFSALARNGINVVAIAQGATEHNISVVIGKNDEQKAIKGIKEAFLLSNYRALNLFIVGTGLIGSVLLKQIKEESKKLREKKHIDIRLHGLANSEKMVLSKDGIDLYSWEKELEKGSETNMNKFITKIKEYNLANSVFVDCTASEQVSDLYEQVLNGYISIVTPNKKANSKEYDNYIKLKKLARAKNVSFLYETNVGAGLPVINTLRDLIASGDKITKIEAVLSGTLSYIFNTFSTSDEQFSNIVKVAREKGYTEPDPRDDLNGMDVARKILILARVVGIPLELDDVSIEPILSNECFDASSVEEFFVKLESENKKFDQSRTIAKQNNKVFRYIASLENEKAKVALKEVDNNHPFYSLSGSDNMISFSTERYHDTPLVVKGPGAGAEVTAGGVLADIIRIVK